MQETWVWSLGREDPLEKELAPHSVTLAWKISWKRSLVGYSPWGCKESDTTEWLHFHFSKYTGYRHNILLLGLRQSIQEIAPPHKTHIWALGFGEGKEMVHRRAEKLLWWLFCQKSAPQDGSESYLSGSNSSAYPRKAVAC